MYPDIIRRHFHTVHPDILLWKNNSYITTNYVLTKEYKFRKRANFNTTIIWSCKYTFTDLLCCAFFHCLFTQLLLD